MKNLALLYFFCACIPLFAQAESSIILSEIMFRPEGSNNEFIELYNLSDTDSVNLSGYQIIYYTSSADLIIGHTANTWLAPKSFAIIFEQDYDFDNGIYNNLIPEEALILTIDNNAFGSSGMSNSSDRIVRLLSSSGDTLDTCTYTADNAAGISEEKIILSADTSRTNWANSVTVNGSPGDRNSISPNQFDLEIIEINILPESPYVNESVTVRINIKNVGLNSAEVFQVDLFDDINSDSTGQQDELIFSETLYDLNPGDQELITTTIDGLQPRNYNILCSIVYTPDEILTNNWFYFTFKPNQVPAGYNDIVINEVMYAPLSGEPEWLELYNNTDDDIDINSWRIKDKTSSAAITSELQLLPGGGYLLITKDESIADYFNVQSDFVVVNIPSLNNSGDEIVLVDSLNRIIDSLNYLPTWGGSQGGKSLERINSNGSSNDSTNWATSVTVSRATPGYINSVTPKEFDLKLAGTHVVPYTVIEGDLINIYATVRNTGLNTSLQFSVDFYYDRNADSIVQQSELKYSDSYNNLLPGDSTIFSYNAGVLEIGEYNYIIKIDYEKDQFAEDNSGLLSFSVNEAPAEFNDIVINEIMYKPGGDEPEWIELYNKSDKEWSLKNWQICDKSSSAFISEDNLTIQPEGFLVISDDESVINFYDVSSQVLIVNLPSLNNSGDDIILKDNLFRQIDSVSYRSSWGGNAGGLSLERKLYNELSNDSTNWSSALESIKATPGKVNSNVPKLHDLAVTKFELLNEFAVFGRKLSAAIQVMNLGLAPANNANLSTITLINDVVYTFPVGKINNLAPGDSLLFEIEISTFSKGDNTYDAVIDYDEDENSDNNSMQLSFTGIKVVEVSGDIIIDEIMYAPQSGEPEWIEIYNRSDKSINLEKYKISDASDTMTIISNEINLAPHTYFVVAKDSTFLNIYNIPNYKLSQFPALNNSDDRVILLNYINEMIDSVNYKSSWGGKNGRSLERIENESSSNDSTNWATSLVEFGGTPGIINSVSQKDYDITVTNILFSPDRPLFGETVSITAIVKNIGRQPVVCSLHLYQDDDMDSLAITSVDVMENLTLPANDSAAIVFNYKLQSINSPTGFLAIAECPGDDNPSNNSSYHIVYPGFTYNSIVINEIHYNPLDGEPEWFELNNNTESTIDLNGWHISDVLSTPQTVKLSLENITVAPQSFLVITKDSSIFNYHSIIPSDIVKVNFPNLNNDTDGLVLKDALGVTIDSVMYAFVSGGKGYSLERMNTHESSSLQSNWSYSIDIEKSTPGRINSIIPKNYDLLLSKISIVPKYPVLNDYVTPEVTIKNIGIKSASNVSVKFYYKLNNAIELLDQVNNINVDSSDSVFVTSRQSFRLTGNILILAEAIFEEDENTLNNILQIQVEAGYPTKSILISEFMSQPVDGMSEWIELYNSTNETIDISGWSVSDILPTPAKCTITSDSILIYPGEYFVIARDTSEFARTSSEVKVFKTEFGTLGNTEDGIILYDFRNAIIDSIFYNRTWDIVRGHSMERLSFMNASGQNSNWVPSLSIDGGTPGYINSAADVSGYKLNDVVINEIMFEPDPDNCEFLEIYNRSDSEVNIGGWKIIDSGGNLNSVSPQNKILEPLDYYLLAADSSVLKNYGIFSDQGYINIRNQNDLGFSNTGESLALKDLFGNTIDSIEYNNNWHNRNITVVKNISLERINPDINSNNPGNWSSSVSSSGATPGFQNSVFTKFSELKSKMDISPNPFSPDNDGYEDFTIISYSLKSETAQVRIKIFDDKGRQVRTLMNNQVSASSGSIIFDGLDDDGNPLRIGMYIVFLEALGNNSNTIETHKKVVVVARKF